MKTIASILIFTIFNINLFADGSAYRPVNRSKLKLEDFVPTNVELLNSSGEKVSRESVASEYTIVYFTATWCGPCRKTTEKFKKFKTKYHDEVEIVIISYDSAKALSKYMSDKKTWYSVSSDFYTKDEKGKLNKMANGNSRATIPSYIIFDSDGKYVASYRFWPKFPLSN